MNKVEQEAEVEAGAIRVIPAPENSLIDRAARIARRAYYGTESYDDSPKEFQARWRAVARAVMAFQRGVVESAVEGVSPPGAQAEPAAPLARGSVYIGKRSRRGRPPRYPFEGLEVGERFLVRKDDKGANPFNAVYSAKAYWEQKLGWTFQVKAYSNGLVVTRVT